MANPKSLTLADFSDRDLLHALTEAGDDDGWASSEDVARLIGLESERPNNNVGSRFAWLFRFGVMERGNFNGKTYWRLNPAGNDLVFGRKLGKAANKVLDEMTESQRIRVTEAIAKQTPKGTRQAAHLGRRTWQHNFGGWRDPKISGGNGGRPKR
jgi:hypothetical protein